MDVSESMGDVCICTWGSNSFVLHCIYGVFAWCFFWVDVSSLILSSTK